MAVKPKKYETLYLVRPDLNEDELTKIQDKLNNSVTNNQGEIIKSEKWADKDLAYSINDYTRGTYYIMVYTALPEVVAEVEKHLNFHRTDVLRHMTVYYLEPPQKADTKKSKEAVKQSSDENKAAGGTN